MRFGVLLLVAVAAAAGDDELFTPPAGIDFGEEEAAGWRERYGESLALLGAALSKSPNDVAAWIRAEAMLTRLGRGEALAGRVRKVLQAGGAGAQGVVSLRRVLARTLLRLAGVEGEQQPNARRIFVRVGPNQPQHLNEAIENLRAILQLEPGDAEAKRLLSTALLARGDERDFPEAERLGRDGREAPPPAETVPVPSGIDYRPLAAERCEEAKRRELEGGAAQRPDALALRREALVLEFCSLTIPFEYDASLYEPVSLFAPPEMVQRALTLRYRDRKGKEAEVRPIRYGTPEEKLVAALRERVDAAKGAAPAAALLGVVRRAPSESASALEAAALLEAARPPAAVAGLGALLPVAFHGDCAGEFTRHGRRLLVRLAGTLRAPGAASTLRGLAKGDDDLLCPLDAAVALGRCGEPSDAALLLEIASDAKRDVWFRRRAVDGLALLDPAALDRLPADPALELSLAAGRARASADPALRGRILHFLADDHQADDAARYCVELGMKEAIPALEEACALRKEHYTFEALSSALAALTR